MDNTVSEENFGSLHSYWKNSRHDLDWGSIFVLPIWLQTWWQVFGSGAELYLKAVWQGGRITGIAPLMIEQKTASFIGSCDVCDYLDFVVAPGMEKDFFCSLLDDLLQNGIAQLDLGPLRPDSKVLTHLVDIAKERNYIINIQPEDISLETELPPAWDEYLYTLSTKQRHEVNRKLRRLHEAANVEYRTIEDRTIALGLIDTFLKLFSECREDKATFLTGERELFFRSLVEAMAGAGLLRLGILELDAQPAAMVMCFDYNDCVYLYNSGYDPQYGSLSAGLLSKALCIKDSIWRARKRFDFLKGGEQYKYHLGGKEISLKRCKILLN